MRSLTRTELKQMASSAGALTGWDFSRVRAACDPAPWEYDLVVRQHLASGDRVLDIGTGGGERFFSLASCFGTGFAVDHDRTMLETARHNQAANSISNVLLAQMDGASLGFASESFDVVLSRHLRVYPGEIMRVLRPGGCFITQLVGSRSSLQILDVFGWTAASFGADWWQPVDSLAAAFRKLGGQVRTQGEFDVPYRFLDVESFLFWLLSVPWPEPIDLDKHWRQINRFLAQAWSDRGIETNKHRGLLVVQK
jgi:SAM-dependent methyltransferase